MVEDSDLNLVDEPMLPPIKVDPNRKLAITPGESAVRIYAGSYPVLEVFADNSRRVFLRSVGTGQVVSFVGSRMDIGRGVLDFTQEFIGDKYDYMSRDQATISLEYDETDGHPVVKIADRGSKNGTFYQIVEQRSGAVAPAMSRPEVGGETFLAEYIVAPGNRVKVPLEVGGKNGGYEFSDNRGRVLCTATPGPGLTVLVDVVGGGTKFVKLGEAFTLEADSVEEETRGKILGILPRLGRKKKGKESFAFAFTGNPAQPVIENRGDLAFRVRVEPPFKPRGER